MYDTKHGPFSFSTHHRLYETLIQCYTLQYRVFHCYSSEYQISPSGHESCVSVCRCAVMNSQQMYGCNGLFGPTVLQFLAEHKHTSREMTHHLMSPLTHTFALRCLVQEIRETPELHPSGTGSSQFHSICVYSQSLKAITVYVLPLWQVTSGLDGIHFIPTLKVSIKPHTHTETVPLQMCRNILFMADELSEQRSKVEQCLSLKAVRFLY